MPSTRPSGARASSLPMVRPPPQPTSRIRSFGPIATRSRPQSVSAECERFIRQSTKRPNHPAGFWHWLSGWEGFADLRNEMITAGLARQPRIPALGPQRSYGTTPRVARVKSLRRQCPGEDSNLYGSCLPRDFKGGPALAPTVRRGVEPRNRGRYPTGRRRPEPLGARGLYTI